MYSAVAAFRLRDPEAVGASCDRTPEVNCRFRTFRFFRNHGVNPSKMYITFCRGNVARSCVTWVPTPSWAKATNSSAVSMTATWFSDTVLGGAGSQSPRPSLKRVVTFRRHLIIFCELSQVVYGTKRPSRIASVCVLVVELRLDGRSMVISCAEAFLSRILFASASAAALSFSWALVSFSSCRSRRFRSFSASRVAVLGLACFGRLVERTSLRDRCKGALGRGIGGLLAMVLISGRSSDSESDSDPMSIAVEWQAPEPRPRPLGPHETSGAELEMGSHC